MTALAIETAGTRETIGALADYGWIMANFDNSQGQ